MTFSSKKPIIDKCVVGATHFRQTSDNSWLKRSFHRNCQCCVHNKWFFSFVSSTHYKKAWHWFRLTCLPTSPFTSTTQLMNADNTTCDKFATYAQCSAQSSSNLRPYPMLIRLPATFSYSDYQLSMKHPTSLCTARNGKLRVQALCTRTNTAKTRTTTNNRKNSNTIPHNC